VESKETSRKKRKKPLRHRRRRPEFCALLTCPGIGDGARNGGNHRVYNRAVRMEGRNSGGYPAGGEEIILSPLIPFHCTTQQLRPHLQPRPRSCRQSCLFCISGERDEGGSRAMADSGIPLGTQILVRAAPPFVLHCKHCKDHATTCTTL
jgi:hypothetical protein